MKLLETKGVNKLLMMQNSQVSCKYFDVINSSKAIRKLSACLICELVFENEQTQAKIGEICEDFTPVGGAVAINMRIPRKVLSSGQGILGDSQCVINIFQ
jgi:hypothetical protein